MQKKLVNLLFLSVSLSILSASFACAENNKIVIDTDKSVNMAISIYNNGMGFVRDVREAELERGGNLIAFRGVSEQINPESAMLTGEGISVKEQNYNYNHTSKITKCYSRIIDRWYFIDTFVVIRVVN